MVGKERMGRMQAHASVVKPTHPGPIGDPLPPLSIFADLLTHSAL